MLVDELKQQVLDGRWLDEQQAKSLLTVDREALYAAAHEITRHYLGNKFDTCSIINARSGNCGENCKWCAQSAHYPTKVNLYPYCRLRNVYAMLSITNGRELDGLPWLPAESVLMHKTCSRLWK